MNEMEKIQQVKKIFIPNNIFKNLDNETVNKLYQLDKNIIQELNQWIELDYKIETYKLLKETPKTIVKKVYSFCKQQVKGILE